MALREKFGRLVLLEETETTPLGREYRAARLGPAGLDRLVSVLCFAPPISTHAAATKRLMDEARLAARLQNPGLVRVLGIGRVEQTFYVSTELVEGRTLGAILGRCSHDSFPFAADHGLMVASRAASALEYLHAKKDDAGRPLFHGLLAPGRLVVAYDGEVKVKGLGLWPALREANLLGDPDRSRLAPEQADGAGDPRSDVYALGLVLLEALSGSAPAGSPLDALPGARIVSVSGESSPLPKPLAELLSRALASDPAGRYPGMADMRKAIDTLLFSGDFTPTTFDLAFFMHTLFRDEMERESRAIEEARRADYREFIEERATQQAAPAPAAAAASAAVVSPVTAARPVAAAPSATPAVPATTAPATTAPAPPAAPATAAPPAPAAPAPAAPAPAAAAPPVDAPVPPAQTVVPAVAVPTAPPTARPVVAPAAFAAATAAPVAEPPAPAAPARPAPAAAAPHSEPKATAPVSPPAAASKPISSAEAAASATPAPAAAPHREAAAKAPREAPARDITPRLGLEASAGEAPLRRGLWIAAALAGVLALAAGAWLWLGRGAPRATTTPPTTVSPEVRAAMARVKELEGRIAQMERERAEAETRAAEEARKKVEAQAAARGRAVDPAALQKAQEEARQTARAEQERRQQQELARIAEARRAEEKRIAEASPSPALPTPEAIATLAPTPTPEAAAPAAAPPTTTAAAPPTTTTAAAPPTTTAAPPTTTAAAPPAPAATPTASPTTPGMTVEASDPRLVRPVLVSEVKARFPLAAEKMRVSGSVEVLALIDETGHVVEARVVRVQPAKFGFEEAALASVRSRVYKPGTRDGVTVKVRMAIAVSFKP